MNSRMLDEQESPNVVFQIYWCYAKDGWNWSKAELQSNVVYSSKPDAALAALEFSEWRTPDNEVLVKLRELTVK